MTMTVTFATKTPLICALAGLSLLAPACADDVSTDGTETTLAGTAGTEASDAGSGSEDEVGTTVSDTGTDGTGTTESSTEASEDGTESTADSDASDGGVKFDVAVEDETGVSTTGGPGLGSCRPSEIYGAAGGFPEFEDPAYANFLDHTVAIVTSRNSNNSVIHVVDISGDPPPPNMNYLAPVYKNPAWTEANVGRIFGLTLDSEGNMYVAPTTVYGGNSSPATIKRVDHITGALSDFATLPNNGPAMGNLNYDCVSETIYVSSHEDGRIYQLDMDGQVVSTYRHSDGDVTMGLANDPGEPDGQFVPLGDRVWAVQSHAGRLYYSVWWEDTGRKSDANENEVWSVAYADEDGIPDPATAKFEFSIPGLNNNTYSNPVSDISFAATGWMLVSERTMTGDASTSAHQSTTYEYDYINGTWVLQGTTYVIGELPNSASGGVDHDFEEGGYVWMTGDALDFYTPDVVYGIQGTPYGGGTILNSTIIDLDNEVTGQDKTVYGDIELPIPGDANPVPPPT